MDKIGLSKIINRLSAAQPPPFALLYRPNSASQSDQVDILIGRIKTLSNLSELRTPGRSRHRAHTHDMLALLPYRQLVERRIACIDDSTPLQVLEVSEGDSVRSSDLIDILPCEVTNVTDARFDLDHRQYANLAQRIISEEIGRGEGANFVLKRSFLARIDNYSIRKALTIFGRLLTIEQGAHWIFCVYTGSRTLIGASPERHVTIIDGTATMNPISGTYRYPRGKSKEQYLIDFLKDNKETDELYMVLDEELKAMSRVCANGVSINGPYLRLMARLAHTEYFISGPTTLDPKQVLAKTMFAPTVTGSPVANACRVIAKYEPTGRAYYAGVLALMGRDTAGMQQLDSIITIRTADIDNSGGVRIDVGATLVRHSRPESEAAETEAKAAALLAALGLATEAHEKTEHGTPNKAERWNDAQVHHLLSARNTGLSKYWLRHSASLAQPSPAMGRRVVVIDCDDDFSHMLAHELRWLGLDVDVKLFDEPLTGHGYDVVVLGPGPGNPVDVADSKMSRIHKLCRALLAADVPVLAVCLGHQIAAQELGLEVRQRSEPNQGAQRAIDYFGRIEICGFYNSYSAYADADRQSSSARGILQFSRDGRSGEIHAIRGRKLGTLQFHAESVLTRNGVDILAEIMNYLLAPGQSINWSGAN